MDRHHVLPHRTIRHAHKKMTSSTSLWKRGHGAKTKLLAPLSFWPRPRLLGIKEIDTLYLEPGIGGNRQLFLKQISSPTRSARHIYKSTSTGPRLSDIENTSLCLISRKAGWFQARKERPSATWTPASTSQPPFTKTSSSQ
jgi:hypothetical protein